MKTDPNTTLAQVIATEAPAHRIVKALSDALSADLVARDGTRSPDHRIRCDAAKVLLSYTLGTPVARSEVVSIDATADCEAGLSARLKSPALRAMLRRELDLAEGLAIDV